jgi:hypothetical protein
MKRMILWAVLLAAPLMAQAPAAEARVNKLVTLKNADPNSVAPMFNQWGVSIVPNNQIKTLSISGPPDKVAAVEAAIKQLDAAPKTIELPSTSWWAISRIWAVQFRRICAMSSPSRVRSHSGLQDAGRAHTAHGQGRPQTRQAF